MYEASPVDFRDRLARWRVRWEIWIDHLFRPRNRSYWLSHGYPCGKDCMKTLPKRITIESEIRKVGEDGGIECSISYRRER